MKANASRSDERYLYNYFLFMIVLVCSVYGQSDTHDGSLGELFGFALKNNPEIKALQNNVEAKKRDVTLATSLPDPTLSGGYFISSVETRVGSQKGKVGVSQMIPWPGKLMDKKRIAGKELSAANEKLNDAIATLLSDITDVYAALYVIGRTISIDSENLDLLKHMESVLLAKYSAANTSQMSLLKIQVEMSVLEDEIKSMEAEAEKVRAALTSLLGGSFAGQFTFPQSLPSIDVAIHENDFDSVLTTLSPKMKNLSFLKSAATDRVRLSKKNYIPNFMLMTDYIITGESNSSMVSDDENGKDPWIVGASITLPLWFRSNNATIRKMKSMEVMAGEKENNMRNVLHAKIIDLHESYNDATRKIELFESILIPKAKQSLALFEEAYANSNASVLDFLDAQRMLLNLELKLARQNAMKIKLAGKMDMIFGGSKLIKLVNK